MDLSRYLRTISRLSLMLFILCLGGVFMIRQKGLHHIDPGDCPKDSYLPTFLKHIFKTESCAATFKNSFIFYFGSQIENILISAENLIYQSYSYIFYKIYISTGSECVAQVCSTLLFTTLLVFILFCFWCWRKTKDNQDENMKTCDGKKQNSVAKRYKSDLETCDSDRVENERWAFVYVWLRSFLMIVLILLSLSVPWEFIRMYQEAVAKKTAALQAGMPPECFPRQMTILQTLKSFILHLFSWRHEPCEEYHSRILIDPVWEVNPSKVVANCFLHPLEMLSSTLGRCLAAIFQVIPTQFQLLFFGLLCFMLFVVTIMLFQYQIGCLSFSICPPPKSSKVRERTTSSG